MRIDVHRPDPFFVRLPRGGQRVSQNAWFLLSLLIVGCRNGDHSLRTLALDSHDFANQLAPLGRAIGDSRIVLLGENGHGVAEFTEAKVRLVEWLHEDRGFDVVVFESGFFECGHVWNRIDSLSSAEALFQCLRYPFQHAELIPLFDFIRARRQSDRPLVLAGMDIQAQGFDSEVRPAVLHDVLNEMHPGLADRLAVADTALFLLPQFGGLGDRVYAWAAEHEDEMRALYDSAAQVTLGWERWVFRLATGWLERLAVRGRAESAGGGTERPARYYELRDEWMANAVTALADSIAGRRKVIVWLHNDHARYGDFSVGSGPHRSTGGYLRRRHARDVFSIGLFMGGGVIADNGRNERVVDAVDSGGIESFLRDTAATATYLVLRDNDDPTIRDWADASRSYLRMGLDSMRLVPSAEFDALLYIDRVRPPSYDVR